MGRTSESCETEVTCPKSSVAPGRTGLAGTTDEGTEVGSCWASSWVEGGVDRTVEVESVGDAIDGSESAVGIGKVAIVEGVAVVAATVFSSVVLALSGDRIKQLVASAIQQVNEVYFTVIPHKILRDNFIRKLAPRKLTMPCCGAQIELFLLDLFIYTSI